MLSILATIFIVIGIMLALYFVFSLIMRRAAYVWIQSIAIFIVALGLIVAGFAILTIF